MSHLPPYYTTQACEALKRAEPSETVTQNKRRDPFFPLWGYSKGESNEGTQNHQFQIKERGARVRPVGGSVMGGVLLSVLMRWCSKAAMKYYIAFPSPILKKKKSYLA